ncbi:SDR family NAD(P)-dependent oxidoreductase [Streptomyces sp. HU2014]|uniref:SDR family NAD(P)-dependent oxidoreductase n=1 Tax=Streptomyces sp. HU2014 TaxID=2939414 RepID=UPI00200D502C|nr:SDR family NAD(P)-dependent oxidoreductase [Streptomyces sp. HU2014]UQI46664.1 SDR family NAD(P)-dependent oxidoreductase [Streptomyces sp. HU2014]
MSVVLITGAGSGFGALTARTLAAAGHTVYASMRDVAARNADRARSLLDWARENSADLRVVELDTGDEASAAAAVKTVVAEQGRLDVLVNNAGMLVIGPTEAFTPEQVAHCFDVNVIGHLRVNRAVLPRMREQGGGLVVYVGSVTSEIISPFQGPYVAAKAAEDRLAETTFYENSAFGIDCVIVQPGAYTSGTDHFAGARHPEDTERAAVYSGLRERVEALASSLDSLALPGARTDVEEVAERIRDVIAMEPGTRPARVVVDPQHHGAQEVNAVRAERQRTMLRRMGMEDVTSVRDPGRA